MTRMNTIICGDAREALTTLPDACVQMAVTSPPYWQLRDYHVAGQLGLERTYEEYITKLCDVFDEVKRVLRPDGTAWVNLSDSYSGSGGGAPSPLHTKARRFGHTLPPMPRTPLPQKSLCLIPFRFALEMVRRGWLLRNVIIWHKPNVVPESVKDRFTIDFEYVFFFAKSRHYYFQQQFEPSTQPRTRRERPAARNKRCVWSIVNRHSRLCWQPLCRLSRSLVGNAHCSWVPAGRRGARPFPRQRHHRTGRRAVREALGRH